MDLMIDLETLSGFCVQGAIVSIGWCIFDPFGHMIHDSGRIDVDAQTSIGAGMVADWKTIQWWFKQCKEVRDLACKTGDDIRTALQAINYVYSANNCACVWGYPATYDLAVLESASHLTKVGLAWDRRAHRDALTIYNLLGRGDRQGAKRAVSHSIKGVKHDPEYDARRQAMQVQVMLRMLSVGPQGMKDAELL